VFDTLVFIGRFQPFHNGHQAVIEQALKEAKEVIIILGSSYAPRNLRNPFTFEEREAMIRTLYPVDSYPNIHVTGVPDYPYNDQKWIKAIQDKVTEIASPSERTLHKLDPTKVNIGLIGHSKDESSYYLKIFPMWGSVNVGNVDGINATEIREEMMEFGIYRGIAAYEHSHIPPKVHYLIDDIIREWAHEEYAQLVKEYQIIKEYKKSWEAAPYAPTFVTVDAVVVCSGHVLLVKRKESPGAGLWALPGGFLNQNETLLDGALRELKEETKLKIAPRVLRGSIKGEKTFDAPNRSDRGRTITAAFFIDLGHEDTLPKVTGADDAEKAKWVPFYQVNRGEMFEDHAGILDYFINLG